MTGMTGKNPSPCLAVFSFPKYPRERFENANIYRYFPTFQETIESHGKSNLSVVVMANTQICYTHTVASTPFICIIFKKD